MLIIHKGYVDIPYGQIHYRQLKQVDGPILVLLHQTASSGQMFERLMGLLARDFHTIAPDTPGFGNSFSPPEGFTIEFLASSLHAALTALGVTSCHAFGHHTGAAIAVQMACTHPKFVRKVVLSGPSLLSEAQKDRLKASLKPVELVEDGSHLTAVWQRIRQRDPSLPLEIVHREVLLTQMARKAAQRAYQAVFEQPLEQQLSDLQQPTLIISGEYDTLRDSAEPTYSLLKNGQICIVAGAGPYLCDQNASEVAQVLRTFFQEG
ncbi:alpha/beta fold hydrolase [Roseiflexus sp.]